MRNLKATRHLILVLAASVLAVAFLAACGVGGDSGGNAGGGNGGGGTVSSGGNAGGGNGGNVSSGSGTVTGTVYWPDGNPAVGASVYFYDYDPQVSLDTGGWSDGRYWVPTIPSDGSYALAGCPCGDLTAYIYLPAQPGGDPNNGGQECWIIMQDYSSANYTGEPANPGAVINWQALDIPCDSSWYASDQEAVQSTASLLAQQSVGYAGPWQAAEARASSGSAG